MDNEEIYLESVDPTYREPFSEEGSGGSYIGMFEDRTFENLLEDHLRMVDSSFDRREGSIIYDALAPFDIEMEIAYSYLDFLFRNGFATTANRYWLIQRAKERGISPYEATNAVIIGKFDTELTLNDRFSIEGVFYFVSKRAEMKEEGFYFYELQCEEVGSIGNIDTGALIPTRTIRGLKYAQVHKLIVLGEEEEETEKFRSRYFESIRMNSYGGNIADYKMKTRAIEGVGSVKVIPVARGGGTVDILITDPENREPSSELVSKVQEILDPVPYKQMGMGVAPVGHNVLVKGARHRKVNMTCKLTLEKNVDLLQVKKEIEERLEGYLYRVRENWETYNSNSDGFSDLEGGTGIRIAKIISIVLNVYGVLDFSEISFADTGGKILKLEVDELPILGTVTVNGV